MRPRIALMKACGIGLIALAFCGTDGTVSSGPSKSPDALHHKWVLAWSDEFNGPNGSAPDPAHWVYDAGGNGWGNQELEYYTDRRENSYLQDGKLVIKALKETYTGQDGVEREYTSARLKTIGKFEQRYGRFEARIQLPRTQGMWPAFWMLGNDVGTAGWPACGEIDIMENIGREPSVVHGTAHGPGYSGGEGLTGAYTLPNGEKFADRFQVFALEWEPAVMRFYVDEHLYKTISRSNIPMGTKWVFDHPFFVILNVAVGGSWPGNPNSTTEFPQTMRVDYVRAYK